ncbi:hypothetical protein EC2872800_3388 [Escherichia coli 2872800]|nr:hypothetical protein ECDEC10E_3535 [Escherichia coli DEC10E]EHX77181.1 hypothetical protein ECDEC14B_3591 [Escherichia coli DEC14B]EHX86082.1 hypothetical protein ECDEC14C_3496 [Escherichia coli DEC14C]EMV37385.1 hypothetical protein EC2875000_3361 [Escherichia coli 2875000]EMV45144.1 hypothetical protein EC2872800_3388 [Escherichia coli 2872800]EMV56540.1 hypothetical protein EC2867750_3569 [Escherichia coli 2867750]EMV69336.1 hypothetical protein EC2866550_3549 [Escherichia coli 2866550]
MSGNTGIYHYTGPGLLYIFVQRGNTSVPVAFQQPLSL